MKLKKFRIKNFKSIIDSGDCYLNDTVTIFAGKNESGKTSILEALEDFDTEKTIRESAKPMKNPNEKSEISITFVLKKNTLNEILHGLGSTTKTMTDAEFEIIKMFPNVYSFGTTTLKQEIFKENEIIKTQKNIKDKWTKVKLLHEKYPILNIELFVFNFIDTANEKALFDNFKNSITSNINQVEEKERDIFIKLLTDIEMEIKNLEVLTVFKTNFLNSLKRWIPNFILFSSFEDVFPNKISFAELENDKWMRDLAVISNLNVATIKSPEVRNKQNHKKEVNVNLNKDYEKFWTQDITNLNIDWDSQDLYFWIEEDGYFYEPSIRSKGKQWHLAFYVKVSARAKEDVPNIILIDEPGLFLHATAQKDILKKLEDSAKEVQIVFSTHSPYLLEADKLNQIRLIHRTKKEGTSVENKVHALADKETLTPILTAIGLELKTGISSIEKMNNVVVEGPSDFYYLNAFKILLKKDNLNFIFGGGAGNMPFVGTILHGWGTKVIYLFDNDQGKKDGEKNLKNTWLITKDLILSILDKPGSIEDIFSVKDFSEFVLEDKENIYTEANSEHIKKTKQDKVLLAKLFLEKCQNGIMIKLEQETIKNIIAVFENIEKKLSQ